MSFFIEGGETLNKETKKLNLWQKFSFEIRVEWMLMRKKVSHWFIRNDRKISTSMRWFYYVVGISLITLGLFLLGDK